MLVVAGVAIAARSPQAGEIELVVIGIERSEEVDERVEAHALALARAFAVQDAAGVGSVTRAQFRSLIEAFSSCTLSDRQFADLWGACAFATISIAMCVCVPPLQCS